MLIIDEGMNIIRFGDKAEQEIKEVLENYYCEIIGNENLDELLYEITNEFES